MLLEADRLSWYVSSDSDHLTQKLTFLQSLVYHYVRTLLHRPLVLSTNGHQGSSSLVTIAQSSKHIIQIMQLLDERRMGFSICLNKSQLLYMAGFGLLYQILDLHRESKLVQEGQRYLDVVISILDRDLVPGKIEFKRIVSATLNMPSTVTNPRFGSISNFEAKPVDHSMPAPKNISRSLRKIQGCRRMHFRTASTANPQIKRESSEVRRLTDTGLSRPQIPEFTGHVDTSSRSTFTPGSFVPIHRPHSFPVASSQNAFEPFNLPNLDYLDFSNEPATFNEQDQRNREQMDNTAARMQEPIGKTFSSPDVFSYISNLPPTSKPDEWSPELWAMSTEAHGFQPQSALSLSDESLTSGEDLSSCGTSGHFPLTGFPGDSELTTLDGFGNNLGI